MYLPQANQLSDAARHKNKGKGGCLFGAAKLSIISGKYLRKQDSQGFFLACGQMNSPLFEAFMWSEIDSNLNKEIGVEVRQIAGVPAGKELKMIADGLRAKE